MARRALLWLPLLIALAFIVPMSGADSVHATAFERSADHGSVSTAYAPIPRDNGLIAWVQQQNADDDDPDDITEGAGDTSVAWYRVEISVPLCSESDVAPRAHLVRTAFPRGPPSA
jgi:hypothetical protein